MSVPRRGPYVLLELATLLSGTANGAVALILPWLILERTGSPAAAGVVAAATALPLLLSTVVSGTLVDRVGRRRAAVGSELVSALAVLAVPLVDSAGELTVLTLALLTTFGAVFDQAGILARESMVPGVADRAGLRLETANGVHEAVWGLTVLIGPAVGGLLVLSYGAAPALGAAAVGFGIAALICAAVRVPDVPGERDLTGAGIWQASREGLVHVWRSPLLRALTLLSAAMAAFYLPIQNLVLPVHFQAQQAPEKLGLLLLGMGAGGIVGAVGYGVVGHRVGRRAMFCTAAVATATLVGCLALLPPYPVMVLVGLLVGVAYGPLNPLLNLAVQTAAPERLRARVLGTLNSAGYAAGPVGLTIVGPLVGWLGVRPTFLLLAGLLLAVAAGAVALPALREFDRLPGRPQPPEPGHPAPMPAPGQPAAGAAAVGSATAPD